MLCTERQKNIKTAQFSPLFLFRIKMAEIKTYEALSVFEKLAVDIPLLVCGTNGETGIFNFLNGEAAEVHFSTACMCADIFHPRKTCMISKKANQPVLRVLACSKAFLSLRKDTFLIGGHTLSKWRSTVNPVELFLTYNCSPGRQEVPRKCLHDSTACLARGIVTFTQRATTKDVTSAVVKYMQRSYRVFLHNYIGPEWKDSERWSCHRPAFVFWDMTQEAGIHNASTDKNCCYFFQKSRFESDVL